MSFYLQLIENFYIMKDAHFASDVRVIAAFLMQRKVHARTV